MKKDLVIIGGGSAGMAAAVSAYDNGIRDILILEKDKALGGILNQCIHNGFGLHEFKEQLSGPEFAHRFIKQVEERNIEYKLDVTVLSISNDKKVVYASVEDGIVEIEAKAVIYAAGCYERSAGSIRLPGERPNGVFTAGTAQKYLNIDGFLVGKKVFILGSGDIGLIMARRMTLEGAKVLGVAELMPYSNGLNRNIVQCLHDFDIPLYLSHTVKKIIGKKQLEKVVIAKVDTKGNFIEGTDIEFECDTLLLSVGLIPSSDFLINIGAEVDPLTRSVKVNEYMETSIKGIFACGNVLHVHDLVDYVTEESKIAGLGAAKLIKGEMLTTNEVLVKPGNLVSYVVPQRVNISNNKVLFKFRVRRPLENVTLLIKVDGEVVRKIKKPFIIPSEMERILFDMNVISTNSKEIVIEVGE